jgi:predicted transcriptional regulator of viral defense system
VLEVQLGMFGEAPPAVRNGDSETSKAALKRVEWTISMMQQTVLLRIAQMQPVTAAEIEELDEFTKLAPSTVRKRISELKHLGAIAVTGRGTYTTKLGRRTIGEAYAISEAAL